MIELLLNNRSTPIDERFPGFHRAKVVETNDPLNMYRIRYLCPEMHNEDMKPEDCPWAIPCPIFGGQNSGSFHHPVIGDWVWIGFEKQHPYGPIYFGSADPTKIRMYTLPQISSPTPEPIGVERITDYDPAYLQKDGRPMQCGTSDKYGNVDIISSVGYFPQQHDTTPPPAGIDAVTKSAFVNGSKPLVNDPDKKYMLRMTRYGNGILLSDQGYWWKSGTSDEYGEFTGNSVSDATTDAERWLYYQRLVNAGSPTADNRRISIFSRYGHLIELRDVGYAQPGPIDNKSRDNEPGSGKYLSKESDRDQRYIRIRSKAGFNIKLNDSGSIPSKSTAIDDTIKNEESDRIWDGRDARYLSITSPYGYKIVLDDRGSDRETPEALELPRGNGILLKGRRSPKEANDPRGFFFEFNENDQANHTTWGTPKGYVMEMNDRYGYMMIAGSVGHDFSSEFKGDSDHEFVGEPTMIRNPEINSHHLKIDHANEYIRLKTRSGNGINTDGIQTSPSGTNQGFEARDREDEDGAWVELVDKGDRGIWFSNKNGLSIIRGKEGSNMAIWIDDATGDISIYNGTGNINIYSNLNVNIKSMGSINVDSGGSISLKAAGDINMESGGSRMTISTDTQVSNNIRANRVYALVTETPSAGGTPVQPLPQVSLPPQVKPSNRGKIYNEPIEKCPEDEINHKI